MQTRDWMAWINLMPPKPDDLHVVGEVYVANPGVNAFLRRTDRDDDGDDTTLSLDLLLVQQPGMWPQVMTWTEARFDKTLPANHPDYQKVKIFFEGQQIQTIDVERVQ